MLISHTNAHAFRGRPTLKDVERFQNGSVHEFNSKTSKISKVQTSSHEIANEPNYETNYKTNYKTMTIISRALAPGSAYFVRLRFRSRICKSCAIWYPESLARAHDLFHAFSFQTTRRHCNSSRPYCSLLIRRFLYITNIKGYYDQKLTLFTRKSIRIMCLKGEEIVNTIVTPFTREGAVLAAKFEDLKARYAM